MVRNKFGFEKKFLDGDMSDASITKAGTNFVKGAGTGPTPPTGATSAMIELKVGSGESERIGRKITVTKILMHLTFEFLPASTANLDQAAFAHESIRLIIYLDKQCNGTPATAVDLLTGSVPIFNNYRNLANVKRFKILHNSMHNWNASAIGEGNGTTRSSRRMIRDYSININLNVFIPIEYGPITGDTGILSTIKSNNVGVFCWSKHGGRMGLAASPYRIRYIDF